MKKIYRTFLAFLAGALVIGLGAGQGLTANQHEENPSLHRDGSAFVKETRILQTDRQAAANRAKQKGFVAPKAGKATATGQNTEAKGGAKK